MIFLPGCDVSDSLWIHPASALVSSVFLTHVRGDHAMSQPQKTRQGSCNDFEHFLVTRFCVKTVCIFNQPSSSQAEEEQEFQGGKLELPVLFITKEFFISKNDFVRRATNISYNEILCESA